MKRIKLTQSKYVLVDNDDYERINQHKWFAIYINNKDWRAARNIRNFNGEQRLQLMHRFIVDCPKGMDVDHFDHNGLNNTRGNLRICTRSQNSMNQQPPRRKTSSKYKGVSWIKRISKWVAYIKINGEQLHLGYYTNEINAAKVYDHKARELFGKFAYLNFQQKEKNA